MAEVLGKAQFYLGLLTASMVNFVDPEMVILGGGVVEALGEDFLVPIRVVAYQFFINQDGAKDVTIVPAKLGDNAALMGSGGLGADEAGEGVRTGCLKLEAGD